VIGVLALQGDFDAHRRELEGVGAVAVPVRTAKDLQAVDGLIIPGGESTTMLRLLEYESLFAPLQQFGQEKPIFGTCAGAILLAKEVEHPKQPSLGLMDLSVERNGYGRQIDSRIATIEVEGEAAEAVFIRAPIIRRTGEKVEVLARYQQDPVLVREGLHLAATFHPELGPPGGKGSAVHRHFAKMVEEQKRNASSAGEQPAT
jgi:pyridoxal 5'-phosphate synthase pdxT subunit